MIMNDLGMDTTMAQMVTWIDGLDLPVLLIAQHPHDRFEFLHANAAWGELTGLSADQVAGRGAFDLFPPSRAKMMEATFKSCLQGEGPVTHEDCVLCDGREMGWQTTLSKVAGFGGKLILSIAVPCADRRDRASATADAIADMADRLEELRLFSTIAAHDARSPLATVASLIDLVRADFTDSGDGKAELLELASNTVAEALEQIGGTLQRARSLQDAGQRHQVVDFAKITRDIATMIDPEGTIDVTVPHARVECDVVLAQTGLRNLLSNAARYCTSRIDVRLGEDGTRGLIQIDVIDDGAGLPAHLHIEDVIRRAEAAHSGFGLGTVAKLLQTRGGRLDLLPRDRESGLRGAGFRMCVPGRILIGVPPAPPESTGLADTRL